MIRRYTVLVLGLVLFGMVSVAQLPSAEAASGARASQAIHLEVPTGLAVAPNGDLFIADQWLNQILERLPNGTFRVVAGTGKRGFSGDDGHAVKAELNTPTALVRAANGTLYFVDSGNQVVRAVLPNGTIVTVAGGGQLSENTIATGTPATEVSFYPNNLTIGPDGDLYITGSGGVLRLSHSGILTEVADLSTLQVSCGADAIAFSSTGGMWLGCDDSRQLLAESPSGKFSIVENHYRPHDFSGIAAGPNGSMIVAIGESLVRFAGTSPSTILDLSDFNRSDTFVPGGVAVAPNGTIYTDSRYGDGFTGGAALGEIPSTGKFKFLGFWKVNCHTTSTSVC